MDRELSALYPSHVADRLARLTPSLSAAGYDGVVIHSGSLEKRTVFDDQYWPLRTVPYFEQWAHLSWPECAVHVVPGQRPRLYAARDQNFWERPTEPDWDFLASAFEVIEVKGAGGVADKVRGLARTAYVGENGERAADWDVAQPDWCPAPIMSALDELRVHKTPYEIRCLAEANRIASRGHAAVRDAFLGGLRSEFSLHLLFLQTTQQDDSETPYKNIVAIGRAASILHHVHYEKGDQEPRSLLLDAGATCRGYASDITRTYVGPGSDQATLQFRALVSGLERLQQALVQSVKVGRPYEALHDEAHDRLGALLVESGLVKMSPEECVQSGVSRLFLPHGLGHSLGLTCHDVGCAKIKPRAENPWLRNTRTIEPGQVFTIEPGLYFIDTLMAQLEAGPHRSKVDWSGVRALKDFGGIRIEDDVVVLPSGSVTTSDNLTRAVLPS